MRHRLRVFLLMAAVASGLVVLSGLIDHWAGLGMASWKAASFLTMVISICGYLALSVMRRNQK